MLNLLIVILAAVAGIVPMVVYLSVIYWLDRYEREPWWLVALVFIWGGLGGAMFGCVINSTVIAAVGMFAGPETAQWVGPVVVAPVVEEVTKIIPLFGVLLLRQFDNATDGLIYGAAAGLGFAMTENFYYFYQVGTSLGLMAMMTNIFMRTCFSALVHCAASASWGFFLGLGRTQAPVLRWLVLPVLGYVVAILIHAGWNGSVTLAAMQDAPHLQTGACAAVALGAVVMFVLTQLSLYLEHRVIRHELEVEANDGVLPMAHAEIIPYWFKRRAQGWLPAHIDRERYVKAATLLAFRKHQASLASGSTRDSLMDDVKRYRAELKILQAEPVRESRRGWSKS